MRTGMVWLGVLGLVGCGLRSDIDEIRGQVGSDLDPGVAVEDGLEGVTEAHNALREKHDKLAEQVGDDLSDGKTLEEAVRDLKEMIGTGEDIEGALVDFIQAVRDDLGDPTDPSEDTVFWLLDALRADLGDPDSPSAGTGFARIDTLETDLGSLDGEHSALAAQIGTDADTGVSLEDAVKSLAARVATLESSNTALASRVSTLETANAALTSRVSTLESRTDWVKDGRASTLGVLDTLDDDLTYSGGTYTLDGDLDLTGDLDAMDLRVTTLAVSSTSTFTGLATFGTVDTATLFGGYKEWDQSKGDSNGDRIFTAADNSVFLVVAEARSYGSSSDVRGQTWLVYRSGPVCEAYGLNGPGGFGLSCDDDDGDVRFNGGSGSPYTHINWIRVG